MLISRKIWLLVGLATTVCAAVSCFVLYGLQRGNANVERIAGNSVPALLSVSSMRADYLASIPLVYDRAAATDAEQGKALESRMNAVHQKLVKEIKEYTERTIDEAEKQALHEVKLNLGAFITRLRQINELAAQSNEMAMMMVQSDIAPLHQRLSASFDKLVDINSAAVSTLAEAGSAEFARTLGVLLGAALSGMALLVAMGVVLGRSISAPLGAMQRAISHTASALDFRSEIPVHGRDEIGTTLLAYNGLLARLRASFAEIQRSSAQMATISSEVAQTASARKARH